MFEKWKRRRLEQQQTLDRQSIRDNCPHDYQIIDKVFRYGDETHLLYCPICEKEIFLSKIHSERTLKRQAVREAYFEKSIKV